MYSSYKSRWLILLLIILPISTSGYNLNVHSAIIYADPSESVGNRSSYFGFSVALYPGAGNDPRKSVVLIGAPRGNSSGAASITEPGVVYRCLLAGDCKEWIFNASDNDITVNNFNIPQKKDNAWFGATIAIKNTASPKVVVCGPNWKTSEMYVNGMCFWTIAEDESTFNKSIETSIRPFSSAENQVLRVSGFNQFYYGMAQAGFSLHITPDNSRSDIMLGAPGFYNSFGAPVLSNGFNHIIPNITQLISDYSFMYIGYSVTSGCYFQNGKRFYAAGTPRQQHLQGGVLVFQFPIASNRKLKINRTVHGEQHGEYFGAALASCDVNNDGRDDLIVGAPFWKAFLDEGRVYVMLGKSNYAFDSQIVDGKAKGGRFGATVTCLGDMDYDGYDDVAIAAPYEDDHGVVYIYNGHTNGLSINNIQRISGAQFSGGLRGFGISISEPRDIDGNGYSDIAIGAYLSNQVVLLRSNPVVIVNVSLELSAVTRLQRNATSFSVKYCSQVYGTRVNEPFQVIRILKVDEMHGRARYGQEATNETNTQVETLIPNKTDCNELNIYLNVSVADKNNRGISNFIDPVEIRVSVKLQSEMQKTPDLTNYTFCPTCPVINKALSKTEGFLNVPFATECGADRCIADLTITMSTDLGSNNQYIIGSRNSFQLMVHVNNYGQPAYKTQVKIKMREPLVLSSLPSECLTMLQTPSNWQLVCDFENPFRTNKTLIINLETGDLADFVEATVEADVFTQSRNIASEEDTSYALTIYFDIDADIAIVGKAQEVSYSYFHKRNEEPLKSITFQHIYEVQKFGVSPVKEVELTILVPTVWSDNDEIEVISINDTSNYKDGYRLDCSMSSALVRNGISIAEPPSASLILYDSKVDGDFNSSNSDRKSTMFEQLPVNESITLNTPAANRTLFINCTNPLVLCATFTCPLGAFKNSLSVAKFTLTMNLQLSNFKPSMTEGKDIIFVASKGSVRIIQPQGIAQSKRNKSHVHSVQTIFVGSPVVERVAIWIIIVSVLLGTLLLFLLILGLIKIGFFNRNKKAELEALKAQTDRKYGIVLETSSSTEILDQY